MSDHRPEWDDYFMEITEVVAKRSTCLRRQIGAIVVRDGRILATGYNGSPSGLKHCAEVGCLRNEQNIPSGERHELCRAVHAEQNAIIQCALAGIPIGDATLYTTNFPCVLCARMLINAKVRKIIYKDSYPDPLSAKMLAEAQIELTHYRRELV